MSFLHRKPAAPAPIDPADWRPQGFGHKSRRGISDPIVEPGWTGVRVIARTGRGADGSKYATLTDDAGVDCTAEFEELAAALAEAGLADELVLDGWLSVEPTQTGEGVTLPMIETPTQGQLMAQMFTGNRRRKDKPMRRLDTDRPIAFVAVDLLRIDGSTLIDLPLLERKRLLDGALAQEDLIRVTPYARPPIGSMAQTWRALGFSQMVYKPVNGRYLPTGEPSDWVVVLIPNR
jgi:ATP-dependent DNA ligase